MRKIVFQLKSNVPANAAKVHNIEISTHLGAKILIKANVPTVLDVTNDPQTDGELLGWYKKRYSGFGMGISMLHDAPKQESVVTTESKEIKVTEDAHDEPEDVKEEILIEKEPKKQVAKVVTKETPEERVEKMELEEMLLFAKEHGIQVKSGRGRSKECVSKLLIEWMKAND